MKNIIAAIVAQAVLVPICLVSALVQVRGVPAENVPTLIGYTLLLMLASAGIGACGVYAANITAVVDWMVKASKPAKAVAILLVVLLAAQPAFAGNCHVLYRQQAFVVNHHGYAQQFVAPVVYAVGRDIQDDAVAEKIAQRVAAKLQALQPAQAVKQAVASTGMLSAKCARCHGPNDPKGGVVLDGSQAVDDATFRSIVKMLGTGDGVPSAMKGVIAGLKGEEKGAITEELLNLENVAKPSGEIKHEPHWPKNGEAGVLE